MSSSYGPPQPDQPWQPPVPPGASGPPPGPFDKSPSDPGPYTPLPPPVDPYAPPPAAPGPYGAPPPPSGPYGAPPPQPGPYGAPPPPAGPYGAPPQPPPYGAPPGYSAAPPYSAPPVPSAPPTSGWPPASGPPTMTWPAGPPMPPPRRSGRSLGIILGITVPIFVIIVAVTGLVLGPKLLNQAQDNPTNTATAPATEDPLAVPAVGSCHLIALDATPFHDRAEDGRQVPCDQAHSLETIASGAIDDETWPDESSDRARELYGQCEQAAQEFLGTVWRGTYTWVVLSLPSQAAWDDGANWYRCDIALNDGFYQNSPLRTEGSLRGAAEPITCLTWFEDDTSLTDIEKSGCDAEHQGELASVLAVPEGLDLTDDDAVVEALSDACEPAVLEFLGADALPEELTFWFSYPDVGDFDQWVLCMLSATEANRGFTASLQGLGSGEIPFA